MHGSKASKDLIIFNCIYKLKHVISSSLFPEDDYKFRET